MPSKHDEYLAFLVSKYHETHVVIKECENTMLARFLTNDEQETYEKAQEKRKEIFQAMGVEFIGVWERLQRLKGKQEE